MPALQRLSHDESRWVTWVNPPFVPYAPALARLNINCERLLIVRPETHQDALWAIERACRSGGCSSLFAWLDERKLRAKDTQRIQVAARQGRTLTCLFRPFSRQSSMAEVRLAVRRFEQGEMLLDVVKRRGGWPLTGLRLPLAAATASQFNQFHEVQAQLQLWRAHRQPAAPLADVALHPPPAANPALHSTAVH